MKDQIVFSSRVRLARNLADVPFPTWADDGALKTVGERVQTAVEARPALSGTEFFCLNDVNPLQKQVWAESHLVSPEFASSDGQRFLLLGQDKQISVMVNEEDHLRIQALTSGMGLEDAWRLADEIDNELETELTYAFSRHFGYLSSCPTNVGTGLRASLMLHLPGLMMTGQVQQLLMVLAREGVTVRGLFGEGSQAVGNIFQISNSVSLGRSEKELIDNLSSTGNQIVERERAARKGLLAQVSERIADQSHRAFGILRNARMVSFQEALELSSMVRLGVETGILKNINTERLDRLWMDVRPAHLETAAGRTVGPDKEEIVRADVIRMILNDELGE